MKIQMAGNHGLKRLPFLMVKFKDVEVQLKKKLAKGFQKHDLAFFDRHVYTCYNVSICRTCVLYYQASNKK